jgi:phage/plasmid-associated DNA primase
MLPDRFVYKSLADKRFEMVQIIGKRILIKDETQQGGAYDETLLCSVATQDTLTAEFKHGKNGVEFRNTASLIMAGNNRPRWTAGEVGGLVERLLLLEITSEKFRGTAKEIHNLAQLIADEEGPAIMMWALQGAMLDYADADMSEYRALTAPMLEETMSDAREQSPVRQWGEAMELVEAPDLKMETTATFNMFRSWHYSTTHQHNNMSLDDWKKAVKTAWPSVRFGNTTRRPHPNRATMFGLGQRVAFPEVDT